MRLCRSSIGGQALESLVERQQIDLRLDHRAGDLGEGDGDDAAAPLAGPAPASVVDQDLAHQPRRSAEEVCPVLPARLLSVEKAQVDLVQERRRLQGVTGRLAFEDPPRLPVQLVVDQVEKIVRGIRAALVPGAQQVGDLVAGRAHAPVWSGRGWEWLAPHPPAPKPSS